MYTELRNIQLRHSNKPSIFSNFPRLVGQIVFGVFYRWLLHCAIPEESAVVELAALIIPLGTAFGTYMVSNVGNQKSSFVYSFLGAYIGEFLLGEPHLLTVESNSWLAVGVSMLFSTYGWEHRRERTHRSCCSRTLTVFLVYILFCGLCTSAVYFNGTVTTEEGETVKIKDAIDNFLNSEAWQQIKTSLWLLVVDIYTSWREDGYEGAWNKFVVLADIDGEDHAYSVLGLEPGTKFIDVRKRYMDLAKEWHPDHHHGNSDSKQAAQEKFIKYKHAYETLQKIHKQRKRDED